MALGSGLGLRWHGLLGLSADPTCLEVLLLPRRLWCIGSPGCPPQIPSDFASGIIMGALGNISYIKLRVHIIWTTFFWFNFFKVTKHLTRTPTPHRQSQQHRWPIMNLHRISRIMILSSGSPRAPGIIVIPARSRIVPMLLMPFAMPPMPFAMPPLILPARHGSILLSPITSCWVPHLLVHFMISSHDLIFNYELCVIVATKYYCSY